MKEFSVRDFLYGQIALLKPTWLADHPDEVEHIVQLVERECTTPELANVFMNAFLDEKDERLK